MKTKMFTFLIGLLFLGNYSFAKILRVGYTGTPVTGVDYTSLNGAVTDASAGDTIQVYPDAQNSTPNIDKKLVIMGFGFNLDVHPGLQILNTDQPSYVTINLLLGSDGTIISGVTGSVTIGNLSGTGTISNITIERSYVNFYFNNYNTAPDIKDIFITSCTVTGVIFNQVPPYSKPVENLQLNNCILGTGNISFTDPGTTVYLTNCVSSYTGFGLTINGAKALVKNCIFYDSGNGYENSVYENNFFFNPQPNPAPSGSNNRWGQDYGVIFNRLGGTNDVLGSPGNSLFDENYYILKSGSPAIGGGFDANNQSTDCGIFGGEPAYKYVVSGIPAVPAIYQLTSSGQAATTNPFNITVSVRSNN